ncbi:MULTISPECIES: GntR family transcriptional regulator [Actinomycetaceae]|uniref:GntR family transcriptional regulator n=1 Tax=Schaalia turicensis TaxID=131111 RepID=A0A2I1I5Q5_9ACTO|nr:MULTISPECIES: GntR family transcriptional regulator [Actinomycetaceae]MDK6399528.1 GntR family transcriptional regulator [Pauljensenia sp. UMB9872]MDK7172225.1 GntR family transcriptional regulator [Pauljensenia sp. UMB1235]PKY66457.1 GntR family transcriptional regulator [Schaalia turicensis]
MTIDDSRPIWVQLVETFRINIVSGAWPPSSKIPSVRELALQAGVNPNTIQRALGELDRQGLTEAERAQGRFVTADQQVINATRAELALDATRDHITTVTQLGLSLDRAQELLAEQWTDIERTTREGDAQ